MTTHATYLANKAINLNKPCNCAGCPLPRTGLDSFCPRHRQVYRRYGHPKAGPLKRSSWAPYKGPLRDLFALNESHAGLVEATRYLTDWMARAKANPSAFKGAVEMQRLAVGGVTARDVLVEVCAVSMYLHACPDVLPSDRARDFAIARAVFLLAPQVQKHAWTGKRMRPYRGRAAHSSLAYVGSHLRTVLAEFTVTAQLGVEALARTRAMTDEQRRAARMAPMVVA
jgi:hypothetical protein